jgi:hypothetical protein
MLLVVGALLGAWTMFDPAFTLQPGTLAGEYAWRDAVLSCNVTSFVPNDLHYYGHHLGNALRQLSNIDSHLLLNLLLPPLLFESAFAVDWHIFTKIWGYALLLAGPGLILGIILTGLTYIGLYPEWPWEAAMLLGGILAATDPGATAASFPFFLFYFTQNGRGKRPCSSGESSPQSIQVRPRLLSPVYFSYPEWPWEAAMLLGGILAATDPGATAVFFPLF